MAKSSGNVLRELLYTIIFYLGIAGMYTGSSIDTPVTDVFVYHVRCVWTIERRIVLKPYFDLVTNLAWRKLTNYFPSRCSQVLQELVTKLDEFLVFGLCHSRASINDSKVMPLLSISPILHWLDYRAVRARAGTARIILAGILLMELAHMARSHGLHWRLPYQHVKTSKGPVLKGPLSTTELGADDLEFEDCREVLFLVIWTLFSSYEHTTSRADLVRSTPSTKNVSLTLTAREDITNLDILVCVFSY
ncbi:MAG: hypothetical protein QNJ81_02115 [Acidimicrobiia bacterium]|nr:hypothetical protein [Acidimicrobiia bacterium]